MTVGSSFVPSPWLGSRTKRAIDVVASGAALLVAAPVLLVAMVAIVVTSRGGPFFRQTRAGRFGDPFMVVKLRTMRRVSPGVGAAPSDAERLTGVGRVLRRSSLDELPQLWNVLKGEMSLVGPRPLHLRYVERYGERQRRRLDARPGLTGWAQVRGRNAITWQQKFELDVDYVESASLALDARIIALTVRTVVAGSGVSADDHATMPEFTGDGE